MQIMILDSYIEDRLLEARVRDIVGKFCLFSEIELFFFGSRVDGAAGKYSDIDIGIQRKDGLPVKNFAKIEEEISQISIKYKIDFVDFGSDSMSQEFRDIALKTIVLF